MASYTCGIVGLPNVGKSTLFNALMGRIVAESNNYPFCTIKPNQGETPMEDERLQTLVSLFEPDKITPATRTFVDIAGLIKGASKGAGLGNAFLDHIRHVDNIIHVLRCFEDENITHVEESVDPIRDMEIIETEMMLADCDAMEKRLPRLEKQKKRDDKDAKVHHALIEKLLPVIRSGGDILKDLNKEEKRLALQMGFLTARPILYVCNVEESAIVQGNPLTEKVVQALAQRQQKPLLLCAAMEEQLSHLSPQERVDYLKEIGVPCSGVDTLITKTARILKEITFFTAGKQEVRAFLIPIGTTALQAAGKIHGDIQRGFIRAEVTPYSAMAETGGYDEAKKEGKQRIEGKDYLIADGDILYFRFAV